MVKLLMVSLYIILLKVTELWAILRTYWAQILTSNCPPPLFKTNSKDIKENCLLCYIIKTAFFE